MKTNQILAEGVVGMNVSLSTQELIVLKSRVITLIKLLEDNNKRETPRRELYINTELISDVANVLSRITYDVLSLEEAELELFGSKEEVKQFNK